jgi:hypothetical protein
MTFFGPWVDAHSDTLVQSRSLRDPCPHKTAFRSENRLFGMIRATPVGGGATPNVEHPDNSLGGARPGL